MKYTELYNAAVMMPYIQGILAFLLIAGYPLATMLVILPSHYKGFFTWVAFFAWIKLWDAGFAVVQVVERSVWAMLGGNSNMAATANTLLKAAKDTGGIGVENVAALGTNPVMEDAGTLETLAAIPMVCHTAGLSDLCANGAPSDQDPAKAWELLDKLLIVGANADLDLANGWYIYIMSALYLAVPAVSGQLVLGAKAGMAGMVKDAFQGVGNDAGGAARTGYQHAAVNAAVTNQGSLGQAAYAKSMRTSGLAGQVFDLKNQALDAGLKKDTISNIAGAYGARAGQLAKTAGDIDNVRNAMGNSLEDLGAISGAATKGLGGLGARAYGLANGSRQGFKMGVNLFSGGGGSTSPGQGGTGNQTPQSTTPTASAGKLAAAGQVAKKLAQSAVPTAPQEVNGQNNGKAWGAQWRGHAAMASIGAHQRAGIAGAIAAGASQDAHWDSMKYSHLASASNDMGSKMGQQAEFEAASSAWEAKNAFASHVSSMAGIAGMNSGSLSPGRKPEDMTGMAMSGMLGSAVQKKASYSGDTSQGGFMWNVNRNTEWGKSNLGNDYVTSGYSPSGIFDVGIRGALESTVNPAVAMAAPNVTGGQMNLEMSNLPGNLSRVSGVSKYAKGLSNTLDNQGKTINEAENYKKPNNP
jgi:hypothetical protein